MPNTERIDRPRENLPLSPQDETNRRVQTLEDRIAAAKKLGVAVQSPERRIIGTEKTPEDVAASLGNIRIEGRSVEQLSPQSLASLLRKNGIPSQRFAQFVNNIRDQANQLALAFRVLPSLKNFRGAITLSRDFRLTVNTGAETIIALANGVLIQRGKSVTTLDGKPVGMRENPSTTELTLVNRREIHRRDGGLAMTEEGTLRRFFDGDNAQPILEQKNGEAFIVGAGGQRVGMKPEGALRSYAESEKWGTQIAQRLKTPESIGAFVSQFYYGQDYKLRSENTRWMGEVQGGKGAIRYQKETGAEDIKHWQRTLKERSGDCEDFALLAQGLLEKVGIQSFTMRVTPSHYEAVYFEPAGNDEYFVCTVGLAGFKRSAISYARLGDAVKSLWDPLRTGKTSGAKLLPQGRSIDGIIQQDQPETPEAKKGPAYIVEYSDEEYFRQFIR